jgi:hypothetical protein
MYLGTRGIFFFLKISCLKIIKVHVTDHTSWLDAASPLSSRRVFASCRAQHMLYLFVGLFVVVALSPKTPAPHRRHTAQSTTATTRGRLFDYCEIIHLYEVIRLYDFISTHFSHSGK